MKRVMILGATSAIAMACARIWATEKSTFFLVARNMDKLSAISEDLMVRGASSVEPFEIDLNDIEYLSDMVEKGVEVLGGIDVVLIAHGTLPEQPKCEANPQIIEKEFATNAVSVVVLMAALSNHLVKQGYGAMGVISSVAGDRGRPSNYVYGSAKAAVSTFSEGLRGRLFRTGVTLTDIRPGFVDTPMTRELILPSLLTVQPEQIAKRIVKGVERGVDVLYVPRFWWVIMLVIRSIPRMLFKRTSL